MLAHADAGRGDQEIAVERAPEVLAQALGRVAGDAEIHGLAAGVADQRHERVGVAARDLPPAQDLLGLVDVHDLVAAAEDRHARAAVDQWLGHGERGEHAERRRAQRHSRREHRGPAPDVLAHTPEVDADVAVAHDRHRLGALVGVLLPHDRVGAIWERRAGEDSGALA